MRKKVTVLLVLLLSLTLLLAGLPTAYGEEVSELTKIKTASNWAKQEIEQCYASVEGMYYLPKIFDNDFKAAATRAEFAQLATAFYELMASQNGIELSALPQNNFVDCAEDYVIMANQYGIIKGVSANRFDPTGKLTREQLCTIIFRMLVQAEFSEASYDFERPFLKDYTDLSSISDWAYQAVQYLNNIGVIKGDGTSLNPQATVSREQAVVLMYRAYQFFNENNVHNSPYGCMEMGLMFVYNDMNYSTDYEAILFEEYADFDGDGNWEAVIVCKDQQGGIGDNIFYLDFSADCSSYTLLDRIDCTDKGVVAAKMVDIEKKGNRRLCLTTEPSADGTGFMLYQVVPEEKRIVLDVDQSSFYSGVGSNMLIDDDKDGVYEGFQEARWSYDVFYYPLTLNMVFSSGAIDFKNGAIELNDYPTTPEKVVEQYIQLCYLKQDLMGPVAGSYLSIDGLDQRIATLSKTGFDAQCVYDLNVLVNTEMGISPLLHFAVETAAETAKVDVYLQTGARFETTDKRLNQFNLTKQDGKWVIEVIGKWKKTVQY